MDSTTRVSAPHLSSARPSRSSSKPSSPIFDLPRLPPPPPSPTKVSRDPSLPPKFGIKKRKPRPNSVVVAANHRAHSSSVSAQQSLQTPSNQQSRRKFKVADHESKRKGLRHFAVRVSRKVEEKGVTTYNEVADELVAEELAWREKELASGGDIASGLQKRLEKGGGLVDEKNIRRRVYDSLNVLMAMDIIIKEKKLISWQGLAMAQCARGNGEISALKVAIAEKKRVLEEKSRALNTMQAQYAKTAALVERNKVDDVHDILSAADPRAPVHDNHPDRINFPFVVISAPGGTAIQLQMDQAKEEVFFNFDSTFSILDEGEVLRRMTILPSAPLSSANEVQELDQFSKELLSVTQPLSSLQ